MRLIFHPHAWEDYISWMEGDRNVLRKLNELIRDIHRSPFEGLGKPEALRFELSGSCSRRIGQEHRLVYRVEGDDLHVLACRYRY